MKIICATCKTTYEVDESRLPSTGLTMKCTQCHSPISVRVPAAAGPTAPPPGAAPEAAPAPRDGRYYLRRRNGKVFGPFLVQAIASMLEQNKLEGDEQVSPDSQTWYALDQVPALAGLGAPAPAAPPPPAPASTILGVGAKLQASPLEFGEIDLGAEESGIPPLAVAPPAAPGGYSEGLEFGPIDLLDPAEQAKTLEHPASQLGLADLPTPKGGSPVSPAAGLHSTLAFGSPADLPAPKQGLTDLPAPKQGLTDLPAPKQGLTDLPAPKSAASPLVPPAPARTAAPFDPFADLTAPVQAVQGLTDLPAPKQGLPDLPAPKQGPPDLPAPKSAASPLVPPPLPAKAAAPFDPFSDLPAPVQGLTDLPVPKQGLVDLPAPKQGLTDLPAPKGASPLVPPPLPTQSAAAFDPFADLPVPKQGLVDLPAPKQGLVDLPAPKQPKEARGAQQGGSGLDYGQIELGEAEIESLEELDELPVEADKSVGLQLGADFDLHTPLAAASVPGPSVSGPSVPGPSVPDRPRSRPAPATGEADSIELVSSKPSLADDDVPIVSPKLSFSPLPDEELAPPPLRSKPAARAAAELAREEPAAKPAAKPVESPRQRRLARRRQLRIVGISVGGLVLVGGLALGVFTDYGFFGLSLLTGSYDATKQATAAMHAGRLALLRDTFSDYQTAATHFETAAAKLPGNLEPLALQAQTHATLAIRFPPNFPARQQAREIVDKLTRQKEVTAETAKAVNLYLLATGSMLEALRQLKELAAQQAQDTQSAIYCGWAQLAAAQPKEAKASFTRALALEANHAAALFGLAQACAALKDTACTQSNIARTLSASPRHPGALLLKAQLLLAAGKMKEATTTLKLALSARSLCAKSELAQVQAQLGQLAAARGENNAARAAFLQALKIDPTSLAAQTGLGQLLFAAGRYTEALAYFEQARTQNPKDVAAALGAARSYIAMGKPLEAQQALAAIRAADPHSPEILFLLGRIEFSVNNLDAAETNFKAALKQQPDYFPAYAQLSQLYVRQNKQSEAFALLAAAQTHLPGSPLVRNAEGMVHLTANQLEQAQIKFEEALRLDGNFNEALFNLGQTLLRRGQLENAKLQLEALAQRDAAFAGLAALRGELYLQLKDYPQAVRAYEQALQVDSPPRATRLRAGRAYLLAKIPDKALAVSEAVLQEEPGAVEARAIRAEARLAQGKLDDALVDIQQALAGERKLEYLIILGQIYEARKQRADAIDTYAEVLRQDPARADIRFRRAVVLVESGTVRDGLKELQKVVQAKPDYAAAYLYMGIAYAENGQESQAFAAFRTAVAKDGTLGAAHYRLAQILFDQHKTAAALQSAKLAIRHSSASDPWQPDAYYLLGSAALAAGQQKLGIDSLKQYLTIAPAASALRKEAINQLRSLGALPAPPPR